MFNIIIYTIIDYLSSIIRERVLSNIIKYISEKLKT